MEGLQTDIAAAGGVNNEHGICSAVFPSVCLSKNTSLARLFWLGLGSELVDSVSGVYVGVSSKQQGALHPLPSSRSRAEASGLALRPMVNRWNGYTERRIKQVNGRYRVESLVVGREVEGSMSALVPRGSWKETIRRCRRGNDPSLFGPYVNHTHH
jgi:hypothetical protein